MRAETFKHFPSPGAQPSAMTSWVERETERVKEKKCDSDRRGYVGLGGQAQIFIQSIIIVIIKLSAPWEFPWQPKSIAVSGPG